MDRNLVSYGLQYIGYFMEAGLVFYLAWSSRWKRQRSAAFYLGSLLVAELSRGCALHRYGLASRQYFYVYWCSDFLLVASAFLLVCLFFRRACRHEEKMWRLVRFLLLLVFVLVVGVSLLIFSRNYSDLFPYFVFEFNQNLYFACLVLNTLLYVLLQQIESTDEELGMLVCGVGLQFAGPAATLALVHLTTAERYAQWLNSFTIPLCTVGMLLVWAYAITRTKKSTIKVARPHNVPVLAEVTASLRF
jgi:membrane-associated HD superfamily phosphohydrolase